MATPRKTPTAAEVKKENELLKQKLEDQQKDFEAKMAEMQAKMMEEMQNKLSEISKQAVSEKKETIKEYEEEFEDVPEIKPNKRVMLVHMLHGGTTLQGSRARTRLEGFGDRKYARYEDIEEYRYNNYPKHFEELMVYIPDKDTRKALGLTEYYEKYHLDPKEFDRMIKMDAKDLSEKLKTIPHEVAISFATYFIDNVKEGKIGDTNKWSAVEKHFNIKINDIIGR